MTQHDALASINPCFPSFPRGSTGCLKGVRFPRVLPIKMRAWLGAESNRRHVDFQSTALPTELPSRDGADGTAVGFSLCRNVVVGQAPGLPSTKPSRYAQ